MNINMSCCFSAYLFCESNFSNLFFILTSLTRVSFFSSIQFSHIFPPFLCSSSSRLFHSFSYSLSNSHLVCFSLYLSVHRALPFFLNLSSPLCTLLKLPPVAKSNTELLWFSAFTKIIQCMQYPSLAVILWS